MALANLLIPAATAPRVPLFVFVFAATRFVMFRVPWICQFACILGGVLSLATGVLVPVICSQHGADSLTLTTPSVCPILRGCTRLPAVRCASRTLIRQLLIISCRNALHPWLPAGSLDPPAKPDDLPTEVFVLDPRPRISAFR